MLMHRALTIGLPVVLLLSAAAAPVRPPGPPPETVTLAAREYSFRPAGDYRAGRLAVDAPLRRERLNPGFAVMKYQVSQAEYARCVSAGACPVLNTRGQPRDDVPITGVSLLDAQSYAGWLSQRTGQRWRLPTDREWAFFAGSRWADDALRLDDDGRNPARRWLARYRIEAATARAGPAQAQPRGSLGFNELGIADLAGNVWEWTQTCQQRVNLNARGAEQSRVETCSIRIAEGRHRAAINDFVRDARGSGCSAGQPPDNLGFRLVRELP